VAVEGLTAQGDVERPGSDRPGVGRDARQRLPVADERAAGDRLEGVGVVPQRVGSGLLLVDEAVAALGEAGLALRDRLLARRPTGSRDDVARAIRAISPVRTIRTLIPRTAAPLASLALSGL
jgi:hypothetical protein